MSGTTITATVMISVQSRWRDPEIPTQMRAVDDCGDGLHPSDSGYCKMGDAIDLTLFG